MASVRKELSKIPLGKWDMRTCVKVLEFLASGGRGKDREEARLLKGDLALLRRASFEARLKEETAW